VVGPATDIPFSSAADGTASTSGPAPAVWLDAAVEGAYGGEPPIEWSRCSPAGRSLRAYGTYQYLPQDTLNGDRGLRRGHQGPGWTTPIRRWPSGSLNVPCARSSTSIAVCAPALLTAGTPSPHKRPEGSRM